MSLMRFSIHTRFFDDAGEGEQVEITCCGNITPCAEGYLLTYADEESDTPSTRLTVRKGDPCVVKMEQPHYTLLFSPGEKQESTYTVAGVGSLTLSVETWRVECDLTEEGGRLLLAYRSEIGGVQRHASMILTAVPTEQAEKGDAVCK